MLLVSAFRSSSLGFLYPISYDQFSIFGLHTKLKFADYKMANEEYGEYAYWC